MRINEISDSDDSGADPNKILGLIDFLRGRAENTDSKKQISQKAFIEIARTLGIALTPDTLRDAISQEPLSNVLEPLDNSGMITFKGAEIGPSKMSVPQAQDVVSKSAKSAMKRGMKK